jgi:hypothetical protein
MKTGRRRLDSDVLVRVHKWDELVTYLTRAAILGGLTWLIVTTNTGNTTLALLEWRVMQLELAVHRSNHEP